MEQWKHIEINPDWEISNKGNIRLKGKSQKPLRLSNNTYIQQAYFVCGKPKTIKIRYIVYRMFIGFVDESKYNIKHRDGNPFNCSADNLYLEIKKSYLRRIDVTSKRWVRRQLLNSGYKKCGKCKEHKGVWNFHYNSYHEKYQSQCKDCEVDYKKNYLKIWTQKKRDEDPFYKMQMSFRGRTNQAIKSKGYTKKSKTKKILGCEWEFLKEYIENRFTEGMTWDNYGEWHVDHIIPISMAETEEQLYKLSHYTNLQPLWGDENLSKNDKLPSDQIEKAKSLGLTIDYDKII